MAVAGLINLQDSFLNQVRKDNVLVVVHLMNGVQIRPIIKSFDAYTVMIKNYESEQLFLKSAISTITATRTISYVTSAQPKERKRYQE